MRAWWQRCNSRERAFLLTGIILTATLLLYTLVWSPLQSQLGSLRTSVTALRDDLSWMQAAAAKINRLTASPLTSSTSRLTTPQATSLATLVERSARQHGLGSTLKRVEPQAEDKVQLRLEQVSFDSLLAWLGVLQNDHAIIVASAVIERQAENGLGQVNARLELRNSGS